MTRATFGVSASCFAANMAVKQNALDFAEEFPLAAKVVRDSFYVDDGLAGAEDVVSAITLQRQLQDLFTSGCFLLRKWNSSNPRVLQAIFPDLREQKEIHPISGSEPNYTTTLGLEWNTASDAFHLTVAKQPPSETMTKRALVSDVAKLFDVLGWFAPATISMKILLQRVWEERVGWDDVVPEAIQESWHQWRSELHIIAAKSIPRCYFPMFTPWKSMVSTTHLRMPTLASCTSELLGLMVPFTRPSLCPRPRSLLSGGSPFPGWSSAVPRYSQDSWTTSGTSFRCLWQMCLRGQIAPSF